MAKPTKPRKIIIDTDPGQDDSVAILLALGSPAELEIVAVTTVAGNVPLWRTTENALKVLKLGGGTHVPVYAGCARPMRRQPVTAEHVHGETGLNGVELPAPARKPETQHAVDYLIDTLRASDPGELTLCVLGPITNVAMAMIKAPDIVAKLREIIWMAGAYFEVGNITPAAEFNVYVDPEAADVVVKSGAKLTLVPLDATHKALCTHDHLKRFKALGNKSGSAVADMLKFSERFDLAKYLWLGAPLHDPCVIAYLLKPDLFSGRQINVSIELNGEFTTGMTVADWWSVSKRPANATFLRDIDANGFYDLLIQRIGRLPEETTMALVDQSDASNEAGAPAAVSLLHPMFAGMLAALVGFAGAFPIVLNGLASVGATPAMAASGLLALCVIKGLCGAGLSWRMRMPISIAWSTPGAALLITTGLPDGGFPVAVGAFLVAAALIVAAGLIRPFGRLVSSIPMSIASAMLAGVLLEICLEPVHAVQSLPLLALPIVAVWAIGLRFFRLWAVPAAVVVTALIIAFATKLAPGSLDHIAPTLQFVPPRFTLAALTSIALPMFIVTMASQNVPGLAVLRINGYTPDVAPIFVTTGVASGVIALFGGQSINLAAITAALCAGPEAHPDPSKRWIAGAAAGVTYLTLGLTAGFAAAFIAASPPLLIQAVAGLALMGSMAGALANALARDDERLPAIITFATTASGFTAFGIGPAFWGLIAGGALMVVLKWKRPDGR